MRCLVAQVHGDPHVMAFGYMEGGMLTCDAAEEVELLSNKYLQIRAGAQELLHSVANSSVSVLASIIALVCKVYVGIISWGAEIHAFL